jgi:CheY-like chemotaxis protein
MRGTLSRLGYRTMEAPNGFAALEVWGRCREEIQLLITDLVMPGGMHGNDLAWRLHQDNAALKVIYVSGYNPDVAGPGLRLQEGVNFLAKPFLPRNLAQIVRKCLDSV